MTMDRLFDEVRRALDRTYYEDTDEAWDELKRLNEELKAAGDAFFGKIKSAA